MNKRTWRWAIAGLIGAAGLIGTAAFVEHWMNSSATGNVQLGTPLSASAKQVVPAPLELQTSYFSTTLPAGFSLKRQNENSGSPTALLQLVATTAGTTDQQFAVTVGTIPTGGLSDVGDYNLRHTQTDTYAAFTPTDLPGGASAFHTISGPAALTVFWPHGSQYVEISLSGDGGAMLNQLQATFRQALKNWQWK